MFRKILNYKQLIQKMQQQHHLFHLQTNVLYNKSTNVFRQGKIMGKLFGHRIPGSKKRWFPSTDSNRETSPALILNQPQSSKVPRTGSKSTIRRMAVLNKLFMEHITDLMATGEISESILGKGLQISKVKVSQDFAYANVFWLASGEPDKDALMEKELQRCSGLLRHELSQLRLMGAVPQIKFVKDTFNSNMNQVEALLRNMNFVTEGTEEFESTSKNVADNLKQEFYGQEGIENNLKQQQTGAHALQSIDINIPEMRHDVLGLNHKDIMFKILTKMRKSKQAWDKHQQSSINQTECMTIPSTSLEQMRKVNAKLDKVEADSEKFQAFLAKRRERRNTPERKKFSATDYNIDINTNEQHDSPGSFMSERQRQIFEAEDYLAEDIDDKHI